MIRSVFLSVVVCASAHAQVFESEADVERAKRYNVVQVMVDEKNQNSLELDADQRERIEALREAYMKHTNELLSAAHGIEPGGHISGSLLEIVKQAAPIQDEIRAQDKEYELQLLSELRPEQIEKAYGILVQERYQIGGIQAVVESTDIPYVVNAFSAPLSEIRRQIGNSADNAQKEIEKLELELRKIIDEYRDKAQKIKRQELEKALDKLGPDGKVLRDLIDLQ